MVTGALLYLLQDVATIPVRGKTVSETEPPQGCHIGSPNRVLHIPTFSATPPGKNHFILQVLCAPNRRTVTGKGDVVLIEMADDRVAQLEKKLQKAEVSRRRLKEGLVRCFFLSLRLLLYLLATSERAARVAC